MVRLFAVLALFLGTLVSWGARAEDVIPPPMGLAEDDPIFRAKPNAGSDVVSAIQLGPLSVVLEETTLSDVRELLGAGRIDHLPGADRGLAWLCFTVGSERLWLANNPTHGGFAIQDVSAIAQPGASPSAACPKLAVDPARLALDDGIWLGRTTAAVQKIIGAEVKFSGFHMLYEHERPVSGGHVVDTRLVLEFREGRVIGLWARKVTRN